MEPLSNDEVLLTETAQGERNAEAYAAEVLEEAPAVETGHDEEENCEEDCGACGGHIVPEVVASAVWEGTCHSVCRARGSSGAW